MPGSPATSHLAIPRSGRVRRWLGLLAEMCWQVGWLGRVGLALSLILHLGAIYLLWSVEYGPFATTMALLTWALLNCLCLLVLGRPAVAAALSLAFVATLVVLSQFKWSITQLTLTFLDFLIIDRDTFSFLHSLFPGLKTYLIVAALVAVPILWAFWRIDPVRIRRAVSAACAFMCVAAIALMSWLVPEMPWEPFQGVNHISNLSRSGVVAVSHLSANGWIEADPPSLFTPAQAAPVVSCKPEGKRPNIVMILDESSFDMTDAPGIKVPDGYKDFFKSYDGKERTLITESSGGPTWYTEFSILTGLSARSFGALKFYVTRITAGKISRGLPQALQKCGYRTVSLYPTYGNFLSARSFQTSTGIGTFKDMADMGTNEDMQPDRFYFDQALKALEEEGNSGQPVFMLVYLTANHFPWTSEYRPDLTPQGWKAPGNTGEIDEYLRRQAMTAEDYQTFIAQLKEKFPDQPFLMLRFGDHQPAISQKLIEPGLPQEQLSRRIMDHDPRYYRTYYAVDALNYKPPPGSLPQSIDAAYLPIVIQDAAGLPLDPTFEEQKRIMLRCKGEFYSCRDGAEAKRFNRWLIDLGIIKNL